MFPPIFSDADAGVALCEFFEFTGAGGHEATEGVGAEVEGEACGAEEFGERP